MKLAVPSTKTVIRKLNSLAGWQLRQLSEGSGVPYSTLYKIKRGEVPNPGIETIRQFWPLLGGYIENDEV